MTRTGVAAILLLAGCATDPPQTEPVKIAPVVTDTFCETARKRSWSVKDTPDSIREAVAWNKAVDSRCGAQK